MYTRYMERLRLFTSLLVIVGISLPVLALAVDFSIPNPLGDKDDFGDIIQMVSDGLLQIAIPVAVIMIVWGGFNLLTSRGDQGKIKRGKDILTWTVVGLAIIFLSSGLVDFIRSILAG